MVSTTKHIASRFRIFSLVATGVAVAALAACSSSTPSASSSAETTAESVETVAATDSTATAPDSTAALVETTVASVETTTATVDKVALDFLTFTSPNVTKALWEKAVAGVEAKYPNVKINLLYTPSLDRQGYAKQLLATGQLPDLTWDVPVNDFVKAGALLPFEEADLAELNVPKGYGTISGKTYNMWNGGFVLPGMHYNKAAFEKAGITAPPANYKEFVANLDKLKAAGYQPLQLQSGADTWAAGFLLSSIIDADVLGKTPDWVQQRKAGTVKFADANFVAAVEKFVALREAGYFNKDSLSLDYAKASTNWAAGKVAIWPMGGWAAAAAVTGFDVGVFTMPTDDGSTVVPTSIGAAMYVSAKTKNPEWARKVAVALVTSPEWQAADMKFDGVLPVVSGITPLEGTPKAVLESAALAANSSANQVTAFGGENGDQAQPSGFSGEYGKAVQGLLAGGSAADFAANLDKQWDTLNK
jgi:ABC-type glycerol-3-phosphate transport system substrate-binding protein